ncbi:hypothetical protein EYR38_005037 [Pleurotus pulmonarius]|nr:hypothetical protein EYR38_005037 [Pleurotus pulmonarius]
MSEDYDTYEADSNGLCMILCDTKWIQSKGYELTPLNPFHGAKLVNNVQQLEASFAFQGIVVDISLAPFTHFRSPITENQARYLRQSISLTGYGLQAFEMAVRNILELHARFARLMPKKSTLRPADFITTKTNEYGDDDSTIDFGNRFFTLRKHITGDILPIDNELDPLDRLSNARKYKYEYTEDNQVRTVEAKSKDNEWKFKKIKSSDIAIGDIVEVQVNFTLIPLGNHEYTLKPIFREVARFDNTLAMKAAVNAQIRRSRATKKNGPKRLKRLIAYTEDDDEEEDLLRVKNVRLTSYEEETEAGPSNTST